MGAKVKQENQMERVRAIRALVDASGYDAEAVAMAGFMAVFHPNVPDSKVRELVRNVREKRRRQ